MHVQRGRIARELAEIEEQMDRAFERALAGAVRLPSGADAWRPQLDVCETERSIVVRVELAGVGTEDARVVVDGEYLQITGRRSLTRTDAQRHLLIEIAQGPFERVLRLRAQYDPDRVTARFENGLLTIELPKKESGSRVIPVNQR